jgi:hypothetical protein
VRGVESSERRERGGSRPGLAKVHASDFGSKITAVVPVTSVDSIGSRNRDLLIIADGIFYNLRGSALTSPDSVLTTDAGASILTDTGDQLVFTSTVSSVSPFGASSAYEAAERSGKLYLADSVLKIYDPLTGVVSVVQASSGVVPTGLPLIALYRDRIFLSGSDHVWYCSRQGDPTDWALAGDMGDVGRALAGQIDNAGRVGSVIKAMIPHGDSSMVFASSNSMWLLRGDPTDGTFVQISDEIGIIAPGAWAVSPDGVIAFLSNDGVYLMGSGSEPPKRWSEERIPDELRNIDASASAISMAYDVRGRGFHLFVTPATGLGKHYWLDLDNKALWPVRFQDGHQPICVSRIEGASGLSEIVMGCKDGYLRKFSDSAATDDGSEIASHVLIGPFSLSPDDTTDAVLNEIHGILSDSASSVTWRIVMGSSAEEAADMAVAGIASALAGTAISGIGASGVWGKNRNRVVRARARGPWAVVWLSSSAAWSYESVAVVINQLGRLR